MRQSLFCFLSFLVLNTYAQVDITKYASNELFQVNPVLSAEPSIQPESETIESQFESDYRDGLDLLENDQSDEALDHFRNLATKYDQVPQLQYMVGLIYFQKGELEKSKSHFGESYQLDPLFLDPMYYLGLIDLRQGNLKEAKTKMNRLVDVPSYASLGLYGKATISLSEGALYKGVNFYKQCIAKDSMFLDAYVPLVELQLLYLGKPKLAYKYINQAVRMDETWEQALIIRALISMIVTDETDQFEKDVDLLVELDPSNYHYHSIRGFLHAELEQYEEAVNNFRTAFNLEIDSIQTGTYKFSTKMKKSRSLQGSLNYYFDHYREIDTQTRYYINKGICEMISDEYSSSIKTLDSAQLTIDHPAISLLKAAAYESMWNRSDAAIACYSKALENDSTIFLAYSNRSDLYVGKKEVEKAMNDFNMMIKLNHKSKLGYKKRGNTHFMMKQYMKAYRDFSSALVIDTTDYDLFFNRANSAFYLGQFDLAMTDINRFLEKNETDYEAHYLSFLCHLNKQDTLGMLMQIDSASKYAKYRHKIHKEFLQVAQELDSVNLMIKAYSRLIVYSPHNMDYRFERGLLYLKQSNHQMALVDFKLYVKERKKEGKGHYYLGKVHETLGQQKEATKHLEKAKKLGYQKE